MRNDGLANTCVAQRKEAVLFQERVGVNVRQTNANKTGLDRHGGFQTLGPPPPQFLDALQWGLFSIRAYFSETSHMFAKSKMPKPRARARAA